MPKLTMEQLFPYVNDLSSTLEAKNNFLSRYKGETRKLYEIDLKIWFEWCSSQKLEPMKIKRIQIEAFAKYLVEEKKNAPRSAVRRLTTVRSLYKLAASDELISYDPTVMLKMPKWHVDRDSIPNLTTYEVIQLLKAAEETSPAHHALIALMSMLGLRVSEVCSINIEDFKLDRTEYVIVKVLRKGGRYTTHPIPVPLFAIVKKARGDRESGPLIITKAGNRQNRNGAYAWMRALVKKAGVNEKAHPHTLRHSVITALLDAGEPIHKVQEFADHADIRTTGHYYRRSSNPAKHPAHAAAGIFSY